MTMQATYSPDDNKLRLYSMGRLDNETFAKVKAAGFKWAPKQELFVAPMWTPGRADLLIELCGEIGDEDTSLLDRAEERAERFDDYSEKRMGDYEQAHKAVEGIAKRFEFGQPILVGHHSEKRARKDKERIDSGMRKAIKAFETAEYWTDRAAGAIAHAKYKERPDVRARRIKKIESELRKMEKGKAERLACLAAWEAVGSHDAAFKLACNSYLTVAKLEDGRKYTAYDVLRPAEERYSDCPEMSWEKVKAMAVRAYTGTRYYDRWIEHFNLRLSYERAMLAETGYIQPPKRVGKAALPLLNYAGEVTVKSLYGRAPETLKLFPITKAEFAKLYSDNKGTRVAVDGTHRVRVASAAYVPGALEAGCVRYALVAVYLTDAKQNTKPGTKAIETREEQETQTRIEKAQEKLEKAAAKRAAVAAHNHEVVKAADGKKMKPKAADVTPPEVETLRGIMKAGGVQTVVADQLFPTPPDLADRLVELAGIQPGDRVLEPSAGTGALVKAVLTAEPSATVCAVEVNAKLAGDQMRAEPARMVICGDFLELSPYSLEDKFNAVVMNPPFKNGDDIKHIQHALKFLAPSGRLVAICANGPRQQAALRDQASYWEELPAGTFDGTGVRAALLVIEQVAA